jgi:methylenetetrahydrofolate dehydrogenase (NADP+)/methenyltetrahydrofolate cyclohydrolase
MQVLDGKALSIKIKAEIAIKVNEIKREGKKIPHLAAILVGSDGASQTYVNNKVKSCAEVGFKSSLIRLNSDITEQELLSQIYLLNNDDDIDGFIVQLPLPKHINEQNIIQAISPIKDVDGFHPINVGKLALNLEGMVSATPKGIIEILKRYQIETEGKHCVILGRSNIVGMPMGLLMSRKSYPGNSTVTICHSRTSNLKEILLQADILIAALGSPEFVKGDMIKKGAVVIDVGITRVSDDSTSKGYRICGDVDFASVSPQCSYISPVPGGVGPMTVVSLLLNTLYAAELAQHNYELF